MGHVRALIVLLILLGACEREVALPACYFHEPETRCQCLDGHEAMKAARDCWRERAGVRGPEAQAMPEPADGLPDSEPTMSGGFLEPVVAPAEPRRLNHRELIDRFEASLRLERSRLYGL